MGTQGRHWQRSDRVWTDEIAAWVKQRCPAREHGYSCRKEMLDELNGVFGTSFSMRSFCTHCYESGIQLGLSHSNSSIPRGEKHWRHRPVGSFQEKKGYIRIKVAEPNRWMQYQRYVWEQNHPGESAEGMTVIFMDGNNRNFAPSNLERVTRAELSVMAHLGCTASMSVEERRIILLQARLKCAESALVGYDAAAKIRRHEYYEQNRADLKEKHSAYAKKRFAEAMADPVKHNQLLEKQREYRRKNRDRVNATARGYNRSRREKKR